MQQSLSNRLVRLDVEVHPKELCNNPFFARAEARHSWNFEFIRRIWESGASPPPPLPGGFFIKRDLDLWVINLFVFIIVLAPFTQFSRNFLPPSPPPRKSSLLQYTREFLSITSSVKIMWSLPFKWHKTHVISYEFSFRIIITRIGNYICIIFSLSLCLQFWPFLPSRLRQTAPSNRSGHPWLAGVIRRHSASVFILLSHLWNRRSRGPILRTPLCLFTGVVLAHPDDRLRSDQYHIFFSDILERNPVIEEGIQTECSRDYSFLCDSHIRLVCVQVKLWSWTIQLNWLAILSN